MIVLILHNITHESTLTDIHCFMALAMKARQDRAVMNEQACSFAVLKYMKLLQKKLENGSAAQLSFPKLCRLVLPLSSLKSVSSLSNKTTSTVPACLSPAPIFAQKVVLFDPFESPCSLAIHRASLLMLDFRIPIRRLFLHY